MSPSKWDEEEGDSVSPPPVAARRRFEDEEEEDVLDSWDAAEDSEVEREKAKKAEEAEAAAKAKAAANKKTKAQRIEEHREQRRKDAEDDDDFEDETEAERRERMRRQEKESDLVHANDLFEFEEVDTKRNRGAPKAIVVSDSVDPTKSIDLSAMPLFKPTTKDQFTRLSDTLLPLLTPHSKKPQYAIWAQDFARRLVKELPSSEIKKIASALTTASNEKMREERAADKGNKKTKAAKTKVSLVAQRDNQLDNTSYDVDDGLAEDDFM